MLASVTVTITIIVIRVKRRCEGIVDKEGYRLINRRRFVMGFVGDGSIKGGGN